MCNITSFLKIEFLPLWFVATPGSHTVTQRATLKQLAVIFQTGATMCIIKLSHKVNNIFSE